MPSLATLGSAQPQSCARYPTPMLAGLASVIVLTSLSVPRVQLTTNSDSTGKFTIEKYVTATVLSVGLGYKKCMH